MIYGNNVDANFEYLQRRMVEKALDALQAKHDELAELIKQVNHEIKGITRCRFGFIGEYQVYCCQLERYRIDRLEAALRKAVEEK